MCVLLQIVLTARARISNLNRCKCTIIVCSDHSKSKRLAHKKKAKEEIGALDLKRYGFRFISDGFVYLAASCRFHLQECPVLSSFFFFGCCSSNGLFLFRPFACFTIPTIQAFFLPSPVPFVSVSLFSVIHQPPNLCGWLFICTVCGRHRHSTGYLCIWCIILLIWKYLKPYYMSLICLRPNHRVNWKLWFCMHAYCRSINVHSSHSTTISGWAYACHNRRYSWNSLFQAFKKKRSISKMTECPRNVHNAKLFQIFLKPIWLCYQITHKTNLLSSHFSRKK